MAFGCLASLAIWAVLAVLLVPDLRPLGIVVTVLATVFLVGLSWLHSDWPMY